MKTKDDNSKGIELPVWQLIAFGVAIFACVFTLAPLFSRYRSLKCDENQLKEVIVTQSLLDDDTNEPIREQLSRHAREVKSDQCGIIPPMCLVTTTARPTASTVTVTQPPITTAPFTSPTTTADPWANSSRPYNSWRLPGFATPINYTLHFSCPQCFDTINIPTVLPFTGHVKINVNVINGSTYLVLHSRNLKVTQAHITAPDAHTAKVTYIREYEMIYLDFSPQTLEVGHHTLEINYEGQVNQDDQIGFYREIFWKNNYQLSYVLGANFYPIHAREAFPCFDEPQLQADFALTFEHPTNETHVLLNVNASEIGINSTKFNLISDISTHELVWAILPKNEFHPVTRIIAGIDVKIWVREEIIGNNDEYLNATFEVVEKSISFAASYFAPAPTEIPTKLDLIGVPNFVIDEKALTNLGLITFREEYLSRDPTLYSAERTQTAAKIVAEHILQLWLNKVDWWNNAWFGKSLANFLSYKVVEQGYPSYQFMEQFPVREMVPIMMGDMKPSSWHISNKNLTDNQQIIESLSPSSFSKGASILRLVEHIIGDENFKTAMQDAKISSNKPTKLKDFYQEFAGKNILDSTQTVESMVESWVEEKNYPLVTIEFYPPNATHTDLRLRFRQERFTGNYFATDSGSDPDYRWVIFMECQLGGESGSESLNLTGNIDSNTMKFVFDQETREIVIENGKYLWIKCNKDFNSFLIIDYEFMGDDSFTLWERFEFLSDQNIFSANDQGNLLNDGFILPHGESVATFERTLSIFRSLRKTEKSFIPWNVFLWHWNYLLPIEERSKYFRDFKQFATLQAFSLIDYEIENLFKETSNHQERLLNSAIFDLLCRIQNSNALRKATELFQQIPKEYFTESTLKTNISGDFLSTVIFYHLQNDNFIEDWDELLEVFNSNGKLTSLQRDSIVRGLSASKQIWRLKSLLENWFNQKGPLIETQEYFQIFTTIALNSAGRDVAWNFYRHNYPALLQKFGTKNRLFNELIVSVAVPFENEFYFQQMNEFIFLHRTSSQTQRQALDQILMNYQWFDSDLAEQLDLAVSIAD